MIPWAVLITGAVGVGGTALGAWLNGRTQTKTAQLADKRKVYAAYHAAVLTLVLAHEPHSVRDAGNVATTLSAELSLIGLNNVADLANQLTSLAFRLVKNPDDDQNRRRI